MDIDARSERKLSANHVFGLLQNAFTRAEIEEASAVYTEHLRRFPEDCMLDMGHGFAHTVDYMEIRAADARRMGLSAEEEAARDLLFKSSHIVVDAAADKDAVPKLEAGRDRLVAWLTKYPHDEEAVRRVKNFNDEIALDQQIYELCFGSGEWPEV